MKSLHRPLIAGALAVVVLAVVAVVAIADSGGGSTSSSASSSPYMAPAAPAATTARASTAIKLADHGLGRMLVDGRGRTLYLWKADRTNKSMCSGACAQAWPPLRGTGAPKAGSGVNAKLLHVFTRADGTKQVSYAGHPLYLFAGDTAAGQANGQGSDAFGALWFAVGPRGAAITKAP
jgi:predicted lipoprotein with Yx(FWY)xxD motif